MAADKPYAVFARRFKKIQVEILVGGMIWQLIVVAAAIGAAYYRWSRRRLYKLAAELPCLPNCYPIIGNACMFLGNSEDRMNVLQEVGRVANQHRGLVSAWMGSRLFICITDPVALAAVSKACLHKDEFTMKFTRTVIGYGSIFAPVNFWHPRRKINAPFFKLKNLNKMIPIFDTQSSVMVDLMRAEVGRDFSIWKYITTFTLDSVGETAMGMKINSQVTQDHFLLKAIDKCTHLVAIRMMQPWLHPNFVYKKLAVYKLFEEHLQRMYYFIDEIIQKKRSKTNNDESNSDTECSNFLDTIIQTSGGMEQGYSDMELREEILVMLIAGSDTSATAACFTAVLLSRHPEVQEKVHQELHNVFGDSDRPVTAEDLSRLKYLEAVIKESLRLYPPVPVVVREIHNDMVLPSGTTLVDGTSVLFNIWGTHRNPAYWGEDVEQFRPERFLEGALRHPAMFVPFSYSVRNCIGATYAMMSAKTALANILRRYRLLPPACARADLTRPLPVKFDIMMKAADGFQVRVQER